MKEVSPSEHVLEVVTPRTNVARLSPAEHFFSALAIQIAGSGGNPVSLEICADADQRRFLVRTSLESQQQRVAGQLGAAYPQAVLRRFDHATSPFGDPAQHKPDEQVMVATLQLRAGEHLPIRTLDDRELDERAGSAQADPLLGILCALGDLPTGWRTVVQIVVLATAPRNWAREHERLALESPMTRTRGQDSGPSLLYPFALLGAVALYMLGSNLAQAWDRDDWLAVIGTLSAGAIALITVALAIRWLNRREVTNPDLVRVKLSREACLVELRLGVFAPAFTDPTAMCVRVNRIAAAYQPFNLATGNGFDVRPVAATDLDLRVLTPLRRPSLLNVRELAGLWHLVQSADDVSFVERTTARRLLPLPRTVSGDAGPACRIGTSAHQGHRVPVTLADALLRRHLLATQRLVVGNRVCCSVLPATSCRLAAVGAAPPSPIGAALCSLIRIETSL